jgi:hypothetical protein
MIYKIYMILNGQIATYHNLQPVKSCLFTALAYGRASDTQANSLRYFTSSSST